MSHFGKVGIVTGSTSGIGLAITKALIKEHAHVVINGFATHQEVDALLAELNGLGKGKAVYCQADLTQVGDIEKLIHFAHDTFGRVDIVVNNAGMQHVAPITEFSPQKWDQIIALNLSAAFHTSRLALPLMRENHFGRIINIASTHGLVASEGKAAYVASKHGILGLTKVIALETALENITCNAVCPGFVLTPLVEAQVRDKMTKTGMTFDEASKSLVSDKQPSQCFVPVEEIAAACLYLASDHASQVRGAHLVVDGGWTIQ